MNNTAKVKHIVYVAAAICFTIFLISGWGKNYVDVEDRKLERGFIEAAYSIDSLSREILQEVKNIPK